MSKTTLEKLHEIANDEAKLAHVDRHDVREQFIKIVLKRYGIDASFDALLEKQLSLYHGTPSPYTFVEVCDTPGHLVRERLIVWDIYHK